MKKKFCSLEEIEHSMSMKIPKRRMFESLKEKIRDRSRDLKLLGVGALTGLAISAGALAINNYTQNRLAASAPSSLEARYSAFQMNYRRNPEEGYLFLQGEGSVEHVEADVTLHRPEGTRLFAANEFCPDSSLDLGNVKWQITFWKIPDGLFGSRRYVEIYRADNNGTSSPNAPTSVDEFVRIELPEGEQ
ncbi:hypothetical protein J4405_03680 [Candidatus Woesearchaeota archaeon]|nr:hypothetical protein [Candidatus Woesearchaeota archaeon]